MSSTPCPEPRPPSPIECEEGSVLVGGYPKGNGVAVPPMYTFTTHEPDRNTTVICTTVEHVGGLVNTTIVKVQQEHLDHHSLNGSLVTETAEAPQESRQASPPIKIESEVKEEDTSDGFSDDNSLFSDDGNTTHAVVPPPTDFYCPPGSAFIKWLYIVFRGQCVGIFTSKC
ncbi:hypothetical protein AAF712_013955 [Marasmius tenuissimus]|uniref:Uncharacterized protein n=1 Tax=Marasmius tenuissimus TaxID=585030 RepID=A0ABR2ZFS5_9AGAR|nr:hypothetical protein PM082_012463 [Marasmius tenuissimus]